MTKKLFNHYLALLLAFLMVFSMLPISVFAEDLTLTDYNVPGLEANTTGSGRWTTAPNTINGSVSGQTISGCTQSNSATLTLKNTSGKTKVLSFDYTVTLGEGTIKIGSTNITANGSHSGSLNNNATLKISLTSAKGNGHTTSIKITNLKLVVDETITVTFLPPNGGSYTVNGSSITSETPVTQNAQTAFSVKATPSSGYQFVGWYSNINGFVSYNQDTNLYLDEAQTIYPMFAQSSQAVFEVSGKVYTDLNDAVSYATSNDKTTIVLVSNGSLPQGDYLIPSGITLLIPFNNDHTIFTDEPDVVYGSHVTPSQYKRLTLNSRAHLTINGTLCVLSKLSASGTGSGSWNGTPTGTYGHIKLNSNSNISIESGGKLYCYGYISGDGTVEAKSGATVWECFQIRSWRGGTAGIGMFGNRQKVFPLNQYYVQNIEAKLIINAGAIEKVYTSVNMSSSAYPSSTVFIGSSQTNGMFNLSSGSIEKKYDGTADRLIIDIKGNTSLSALSLTLAGKSLSTQQYVLPITSNITINVVSGKTTIPANQDVALLPGTIMNIGENAEVEINSNAYVYDQDQWGNYAGTNLKLIPVGYSTVNGATTKRTDASLVDAKIDVNGTLTVKGKLYTTADGAEIVCTGKTGRVVLNVAPSATATTYQATQTGTNITYVSISCNASWLKNGSQYAGTDDEFTKTVGAAAGTTFFYCATHDKWETGGATVTFNANGGTGTMADQTFCAQGGTLTPNTFTRDGYTFAGWNTAANGSGTAYADGASITPTGNLTLYAQWEELPSTYTVTWKNYDGTILKTDTDVAAGATPSYDGVTPTKPSDAQYTYTFAGWAASQGGAVIESLPAVNGDVSYYAVFHKWGAPEWTWNGHTGATATFTCVNDSNHTQTVEATITNEVTDNPTCQDTGVRTFTATVEFNGRTYTDSITDQIPALHHDWDTPTYEWAADNSTVTATRVCKRDASHIETETVNTTSEVNTPATCEGAGTTTYTATFENEAFETQTKDVEDIEPIGHDWDEPTYEWADDNSAVTATRVCKNDPAHTETETVNTTSEVTKPATCEGAGTTTYTATFANEAFETQTKDVEDIEPIGHDWNEPTYEWAADNSTVTATRVCKNDESHVETEVGSVTSEVTTPATCEGKGTTTYTATFTNSAFETQTKTVEDIDALGHIWGEPVWEWAEDYTSATATFTCNNNASHVEVVTAEITSEQTESSVTYTATAEHDGKTYYDVKTATRSYTVTWQYDDGTLIDTTTVQYGDEPSHADPSKDATAAYTYTFEGWMTEGDENVYVNGALPEVHGDVTYTAVFEQHDRYYSVRFVDYYGYDICEPQSVVYHGSAVEPSWADLPPINNQVCNGWDNDAWGRVENDLVIHARYVDAYTVTWMVDGEVVKTDTLVATGSFPMYNGETPNKEPDAQFIYTFAGWKINGEGALYNDENGFPAITADTTFVAFFNTTLQQYTITWLMDDDSVINTTTVAYGATPQHEAPTKPATAEWTYYFAGWSPEVVPVTGDKTYKAVFSSVKNKYTVTFVDEDGTTVLDEQQVEYDTVPVYAGETPTKEGNAQYTYTFAGWDPMPVAVTGPATYTATYTSTVNKYTITWKNEDGTTIDTTTVEYGVVPTHADPTKAATDEYTYTFKGWTPEIVAVTGEATYTATFTATKRSYTITWNDDEGNLIDTTTVEYGVVPTHADPVKEATAQYTYTFAGWTPEVVAVTGEATYTATFTHSVNTYTVVWKDWDGTVLETDSNVSYGTTPTYDGAVPTRLGWTFMNWSPVVSSVIGDVIYTATYSRNSYTVTWKNGEDTLETDYSVYYGDRPSYDGETPEKDPEQHYTYSFKGWKVEGASDDSACSVSELPDITESVTYVAVFERIGNTYTITFDANGGEGTMDPQQFVFNGNEGVTLNPNVFTRTGYDFLGWNTAPDGSGDSYQNGDMITIYSNTTLYAQWTINKYTITWLDYNGNLIDTTEVNHGELPAHSDPTREPDAEHTYTFDKWTPDIVFASEDATYTAVYTESTRYYKIRFFVDDVQIGEDYYVEYLGYVEAPDVPEQYIPTGYYFGWDSAKYYNVTEDADIHAVFMPYTYTITWNDDEGNLIDTTTVEYGVVPTHADPVKEATAQYTYTFAGWDPEIVPAAADATYTAQFTQAVRKYNIIFRNEDLTTLQTVEVAYGVVPEYTGETPTKESTVDHVYTFAGWDPTPVAVEGEATYTATFTEGPRNYTITWKNDDGSVIDTTTVEYGVVPTHAEPTKPATAQHTYTFSGWTPAVVEVTGDATYTATYTSTVNTYTVTWKNYDGTVLETDADVPYGTVPSYDGENPTKEGDAQFSYIFSGWTPGDQTVTGDITFTAQFTPVLKEYTITWVDGDGKTLKTEQVAYGETPVYTGETPTKAATAQYSYTFVGWSAEENGTILQSIPSVTGPATYYAVFTPETNNYTITFDPNYEGFDGEQHTQTAPYGDVLINYTGYTRDGYRFECWKLNDEVTGSRIDNGDTITLTGDITLYAIWTKVWTVTFKNWDGTVLQTKQLSEDNLVWYYDDSPVPTRPSDVQYNYTFIGWSSDNGVTVCNNGGFPALSGDIIYIAQYSGELRSYTVRFVNYDGSVLQEETLCYGANPTYHQEEMPSKPDDAQFTHEFVGWSPEVTSVTGDATYTAQFNNVPRSYTITWVDGDGKTLKTEQVAYGETPVYTGETPTKPATAQYTYTFTGWAPEITEVTGNATYTAQFSQTLNTYTITWVIDGVSTTETYAYGATPTHADPTKPADAQYTYAFTGWTPAITTVTSDATYTAQFSQTLNTYTITWVIDGVSTTETYAYGATPTHADPTKPADAQYTYTFTGWTPEITTVTGDATYTAVFSETVNKYTVIWKNYDGEILETDKDVPYGTIPTYNGETPAKPGNAQHSYTFNGWDPAVSEVNGDVVYTATFTEATNTYTVTWNNYDGSLLEKDTDVAYGETPEYNGETPAKHSDDEFDYSFIGWTPAITAVTGNTTYTATFKAVRRSYEIKFVNYDNSPLLTINVPYGETPEYTGETPAKPADAQYTYTFTGWTPAITTVTGDATYTAQFSETLNTYTITWVIDGVSTTETYAYGATPTHADPTKPADAQYTYTFTGWTPEITTVTGDATYTAVFSETVNTYTITWVIDGESTEETYPYGETPEYTGDTPTKPADTQYTYAFTGWDPEIAEVTGDATYTAQFESETRKYTITWTVNGEDITSDVPYGTMPKYPGETPTKPSDDLYDYTFTGWSPELAEVTGEASYTAEFEKTLNSNGLTVKVELTAAAAIDRTYLFEISKDGEVIVIVPVTVKAGTLAASVLVKGLSAEGGYTVKEITAWSWDHEVTNGPSKPAAAEGEVLFINKRRNVSWLFSEAWLAF